MANNQFGNSLYRCQRDMLDAIAHDFITSGGDTSHAEVCDILRQFSDDKLAVDCVTGWALNQPSDPHDPDSVSHMASQGYEASDLERAFARFREAA